MIPGEYGIVDEIIWRACNSTVRDGAVEALEYPVWMSVYANVDGRVWTATNTPDDFLWSTMRWGLGYEG